MNLNHYDWTDSMLLTLRHLWTDNAPMEEISRSLRVSKQAIYRKVKSLGLPMRYHACQPRDICQRKGARRFAHYTRRELHPLPVIPRDRPGFPCCWPLGEPRTPDFRYCDGPTVTGKPYCEEHCRTAYLPLPKRADEEAA